MSQEEAQQESHKKAQKAHKDISLTHFVSFVPFCGK
jgi:hypothetical protein